MATRQLKYESLSGKDRHEQEKWAQKQLAKSTCVRGFLWAREIGGYRCHPPEALGEGGHFVTDELLAERKGRQYYKLYFQDSFNGTLSLPDGSLFDGPLPKLEYPDQKPDLGIYRGPYCGKLRIDSTGQKWETYGVDILFNHGPNSPTWREEPWTRI
jgi:hypothetical protein